MSEQHQEIIATNDDEDLVLPADTLAILQSFLAEKSQREKLVENDSLTATSSDPSGAPSKPTFDSFEENWQLSQFWYNERTKKTLAALTGQCRPTDDTPLRVALLSCPSLYDSVRSANPDGIVHIFEFDQRFAAYGPDFVHYDYNLAPNPDYLSQFSGYFDLVIADPPFLSEECIEKISLIIRKIAESDSGRIVLCSGQVVAGWAAKFLQLQQCAFHPEHERNLGNEFSSYANFDLDALIRCEDGVLG